METEINIDTKEIEINIDTVETEMKHSTQCSQQELIVSFCMCTALHVHVCTLSGLSLYNADLTINL